MEFRQGTCTSCQNSFRVPATFTAAKAKCPKCGGVVEIGAASAPAAPSAKPTHAAEPAAKPVAHATKPASAAPVAKESLRATAAAAKDHVKSKDSHAPAHAHSTAHDRVMRHRHRAPEKPNRWPLIVGGLVVVAVVIGIATSGGKKEPVAAPPPPAAVAKPDFSGLADAERLEGTSDGEWEEMNKLVATYITPPFGTNSQRSGDLLMHKRIKAVPAILNGYKRLDFTTDEGTSIGWKMQTLLLQGLCEGTNFGWRKETRADAVASNKTVIERWFKAWNEAHGDTAMWAEISKQAAAEKR